MAATSWTVETLNHGVDAELDGLPPDMRACFVHICQLIEEVSLERIRAPHVHHVRGRLWEMRLRGKEGISRALYVTGVGRHAVVVRVFVKTTRRILRREIELALKRPREVLV